MNTNKDEDRQKVRTTAPPTFKGSLHLEKHFSGPKQNTKKCIMITSPKTKVFSCYTKTQFCQMKICLKGYFTAITSLAESLSVRVIQCFFFFTATTSMAFFAKHISSSFAASWLDLVHLWYDAEMMTNTKSQRRIARSSRREIDYTGIGNIEIFPVCFPKDVTFVCKCTIFCSPAAFVCRHYSDCLICRYHLTTWPPPWLHLFLRP